MQARTWKFLGKLRELATFSVESEDEVALERIKATVFRPAEPPSARIQLFVADIYLLFFVLTVC